MKTRFASILALTFALTVLPVQVLAAEILAEILKQIDQFKADAEAKKDMPLELAGVKLVNTDEAARLFKAKSAIFLDNRSQSQFDTERIQGAKLFPVDDLLKDPSLAGKLDKSKTYVLYCNGAHCWRSPAVALILSNMGYRIFWYREGLPGWKKSGLLTE